MAYDKNVCAAASGTRHGGRFACCLWGAALLLSMSTPAVAEEEHPLDHALGVSLGARADTVRDDLLVPLTFAGPGIGVALSYRGAIGPGELVARADVGFSYVANRYGHGGATLDWGADAAWTVPIYRLPTSYWALGPAVVLDSRLSVIYSWDDAHAYWLGTEWLGPQLRYGQRLSETWSLESSLTFALAGFERRPPAYRYRKQDLRPGAGYLLGRPLASQDGVTTLDLQAVRLEVGLRPSAFTGSDVGRGWSWGLDARMTRTTLRAYRLDLSACLYASYAWGLP
jgi:hypothetical protein